MTTPVVTNIITGGATIWKAPVGEALPDEDSIDYGVDWGGNWERVGFTKAPLAMLYEFDVMEVEVEEALASVGRVKTAERLSLETTLAELTAEYLALVAGGGTVTTTAAGVGTVGKEELSVGGSAALAKAIWGFEGKYIDANGVSFPIRVFIWIATAMINGEITFSKKNGEYPGIPLKVDALEDVSQAEGERLWKWLRVTEAGT